MTTIEKFTTETASCSCCLTRYHIYMFPLENQTRNTERCLSCKICSPQRCDIGKLTGKSSSEPF